jgi:predicted TIM-barrel fold metal-dependent hydrolase
VSGSFQLYDQDYLVDAIKQLGKGSYVGVTQLPLDELVDENRVKELNKLGVRAIRYNITRGVAASTEDIRKQALEMYRISNWHAEFYIDTALLADQEHFALLGSLPVVSIDHVGFSALGLSNLIRLLKHRKDAALPSAVKLTGFGRYLGSPEELRTSLLALFREFPETLIWGSDLPSTRARVPFDEPSAVSLIHECAQEVCSSEAAVTVLLQNIYWDNAERLYLHS